MPRGAPKTKWPTLAEIKDADRRDKHAGIRHAHGCMKCRHRYTDMCENPREDELCTLCASHGQRPVAFWPESWMPVSCCVSTSVQLYEKVKADRDILDAYKLCGRGPWWKCKTCGRTHPFDPRRIEDYPMTTTDGWMEVYGDGPVPG